MPEKNIEHSLKRLEEIVGILEKGEVSLEESLKLFEEGVKISGKCSTILDNAEQRIEVLTRSASGKLVTAPFEED